MTNRSAKNRTPGAGRSTGPEMKDAHVPEHDVVLPASDAAPAGRNAATLALHMGLPGTRLGMVLGGPHPLLVHLVRAMARAAAQADHGAELTGMAVGPAYSTEN